MNYRPPPPPPRGSYQSWQFFVTIVQYVNTIFCMNLFLNTTMVQLQCFYSLHDAKTTKYFGFPNLPGAFMNIRTLKIGFKNEAFSLDPRVI